MTGARRDPAWKYGVEIEVPAQGVKLGYKYVRCNFCNKEVKGGITRLKQHLAHQSSNVASCLKVPEEVKNEINGCLKAFQNAKHTAQKNYQEMVDSGSYFGDHGAAACGSGTATGTDGATGPSTNIEMMSKSSRGVRGPMDRFVNDKGDDENEDGGLTAANAKELRNRVCLDIGRFFFENGIPFNCARSASFTNMVRSIGNYGRGLKAPTMYELRTWILNEEEKTTIVHEG
ncbi:hypothetical protein C2S51_017862 [Perilla frutescens var. frutescens]|nr:hypothetical protein C2S51_017862 [Perilla frutescens var. frutescens]